MRKLAISALCLAGLTTAAAAEEPRKERIPVYEEPTLGDAFPALGDATGPRAELAKRGFRYGLTYIGEAFHIASGGLRRGTSAIGRLEVTAELDFGKLAGWNGLTARATAFRFDGSGPSRSWVGNLMTITEIEAISTTRLWEAWLQQEFADGALSIRFGQLGADSEFFVSQYADPTVNGTFGWPMMFGSNLLGGGPAFPFSAIGVRARYKVNSSLELLAGVFNGDPAGPGIGDPQLRNRHGLNFRLRDPAFVIAEAQIGYSIAERPGMLKLGGWKHFGRFADQRFGTDGLSLADPLSNGLPVPHRGDWSVYAVLDQMLVPFEPGKGLAFFARAAVSPSNRNAIDVYLDGGFQLNGFRGNDLVSVGLAWGRVSRSLRGLDLDANAFNGVAAPVRGYEAMFEASYRWEPFAGLNLQPWFQYVFHPGGHVADPADPLGLRPIRNAAVFGVRMTARY